MASFIWSGQQKTLYSRAVLWKNQIKQYLEVPCCSTECNSVCISQASVMQSNTTFNICIAKTCFYMACLNNYMFRPPYQPSSGYILSYCKANYTIYVFVFVDEISFTSIIFAFKIITVAVELRSYSNIKGINSIKSMKSWVLWSGWGGMVSNWGYSCLAMLVSLFGFLWQCELVAR